MPVYTFEGRREQTGEFVSGVREATSHTALGSDLLGQGILLTRYEEKSRSSRISNLLNLWQRKRVPVIERVLFARYFGLMLRAGFDAKRSLVVLQEQTSNKSLRAILEAMHHDVEQGKTLAESMERWPRVFSSIFLSFIRVGEMTGRLQESLGVLAEQLQKEYELKRAVRGAMMYPAVIIGALFAVGFAMLVFVIPKLADVFEGFNVELPLATRILLKLGEFFEVYWYVVLVLLALVGAGGWALLRMYRIKAIVFHTLLFIPVIGPIMQKVNLARFNRNLSALLRSGVAFTEAIKILGDNTPHPTYAAVLKAAMEHIKAGKPLSEFLAGYKRLFPALVVSVIKIGEETGELDRVLEETAIFFESEIDQTMKNLTSILEPILMVIIGLAVGGLAISIISPIYNLVSVI